MSGFSWNVTENPANGVPNIQVPGIRQSVPQGYIVGRINAGKGPVELIPLSALGTHLVKTGVVAGGATPGSTANPSFEFLGLQASGPFVAHQRFDMAMAPRAVLFPSVNGAGNSHCACEYAATASYTFHLVTDYAAYLASGTHVLATFAFAAGSKTGTITWGTPAIIPQWGVLYLIMAATPDATFGGLQILLAGDR